ncbi:MAG TPA: CvpA family protein [Verrucomicrobiae bacterium]|jgi:membrane protein required for colicin V production|nr:CvpA family protein [Verrucomicrobiae bacterium]
MNTLDWALVVVLLLSVLLAAAQGFLYEVFSLAGTVFGFLLAAWGYERFAPRFLTYVKAPAIADLASFLTIFLVVVLLAGAVARISRWAAHEAGLRWVDRALGGAFGLLRGIVILSAGLMAVTAFAPESQQLQDSRLAGYFLVAGHGVSWLAPSEVRQKFREGIAKLREGAPGATRQK